MYLFFFSFVDLNDCFANNEIYHLKNDQMNGICGRITFIGPITMEECKLRCLHYSMCFGICIANEQCIIYMYEAKHPYVISQGVRPL